MEFLIFLVVCFMFPELAIILGFIYCCLLFGNTDYQSRQDSPKKGRKTGHTDEWYQ